MSYDMFTLDGIALAFSATARNLAVVFHQDMPFNSHLKQSPMSLIDITCSNYYDYYCYHFI